jgi:hypothetical protein
VPASRLQQWAAYHLFSKLKEITCVANVSDQKARKYKEHFSKEIEGHGSLYPVLKSSNTEYYFSQVRIAVSRCLCRNTSAMIFKFNRSTDLNFNMNKRQVTLLNFGIKKSHLEGVCDATNNDLSTQAYTAISKT